MNKLALLFGFCFLLMHAIALRADDIQGFSEDGHYLVFDHTEGGDGGMDCETTRYYVDVPQNKWVFPPTHYQGSFAEHDNTARSWRQIQDDEKTQSLNVLPRYGKDMRLSTFESTGPFKFSWREKSYQVELNQYDLESPTCRDHRQPTKGFELKVRNLDDNKVAVFQKDVRIPKSRNCPWGYWVSSMSTYKNYGIVFVTVSAAGETLSLAVTGELP